MIIYYSEIFLKQYKKVPFKIKIKLEKLESLIRQNPFNPILKTHPLVGKLKGFYSLSVDYHCRIIFTIENETEIWFHSIGTHSIYK